MDVVEAQADALRFGRHEGLAQVLAHDRGPTRSAVEHGDFDSSHPATHDHLDLAFTRGRFAGVVDQIQDRVGEGDLGDQGSSRPTSERGEADLRSSRLGGAVADSLDQLRDLDCLEVQALGLELGARHAAQDLLAAIERLGRHREIRVPFEIPGAAEPGELELGGIEGCGEFVGEARRQGPDRAQPIDACLAFAQELEVGLEGVECSREPGGENPERSRHCELGWEEQACGEQRVLEAGRNVGIGLVEPDAAEHDREEEEAQATLEEQRPEARMYEEDREQGVPGAARHPQQSGEAGDICDQLGEDVSPMGQGPVAQGVPGEDVEQGQRGDDGEKRREQALLEYLELEGRNDREQLGRQSDPTQPHDPLQLACALREIGRDRRCKE